MSKNQLKTQNTNPGLKARNKQIRRENLQVLCEISNLLKRKGVIVNKFTPSQYLVNGKALWQQYQLELEDGTFSAEMLIHRDGEATLGVVLDGYFVSDTYVDRDKYKRVTEKLNLLKKQWEKSLQRQ